ncbi:MFS transporter [Pseudonocardia sp. TRM90224]|uniref:MFS transporter n=1 Tax=Pseudonocardia sp. TRM90224 TaxID=2812678 RepID=UPI001E3A3322|nr:MFS transporter [Pseudonocardia sp. TRM90224]
MAVPTQQAAPRAARSRWLALAVLCGGMLMIILDGTIVSVALPAIQESLGFTATGLAWTVNAYLVPLGGLLLLAGRLGDLLGRRRMLVTGLTLFVLASLLCGLAISPEMLIGARFVQGVAAAMASAVVLGMIVELFPEPVERAKAMGVYSFVGAAGASAGVILGGLLTETVGWRWIFLVNVPIGVVAVVLAMWVVQRDGGAPTGARPDVLGGVLVTAGLVLAVYTIVDESGLAFRVATGVLAVLLLVGFVIRQRRIAEPLVDLSIFRSRGVSVGNVVQLLFVAGMMGFQFTAALFLQQALGFTPGQAGLALLPVPVVIAVVSIGIAGPLIGRFRPGRVLIVGEAVLVLGLGLLAFGPSTSGYVVGVLPSMILLGIGGGLTLPAVSTVMMADATPGNAGLASGLANTSQQVGAALGIAVLAAIAAAHTAGLRAGGVAELPALAGGFQLAFAISTVLVLASVGLTVGLLRRR